MDLSSLNNKQLEAVTAPLGPVLVLAGAGSGKTRALAFRIAYLCEKQLVSPENILALTFTNKAAKEMAERVRKILNNKNSSANLNSPTAGLYSVSDGNDHQQASHLQLPLMGTFHSICAKILRKEISVLGYTRGFTIFDTEDQNKILKNIINDLYINKKYGPSYFRALISSAKNILQTPEEFKIGLAPDMQNLAREVYVRYQDFLYKQNGLDFDDLLMLTVKIFQNFPEVLKKYQEIFKYILVDEYQDTNQAQYVFLHLLAKLHKNLFVVGDDAQSIYGFRGSDIRNILNFEEDFSNCLVIKLEQNYRSSKNILAVAQKVIEINPEQKAKILWTENNHGTKVIVQEVDDEIGEAEFVAKKIIKLSSFRDSSIKSEQKDLNELVYEQEEKPQGGFSILDHFLKKASKQKNKDQKDFISQISNFNLQLPKKHESLNQFAVLFRTHSQSRALEEVFMQAGIPYQIVGGIKFYQRKEIKDLIAYMRLTLNCRDLVALQRVINEPARGIGDKSFGIIRDIIISQISNNNLQEQNKDFIFKLKNILSQTHLSPKIGQAIDNFFNLLELFSCLEPTEDLTSLLKLIVNRIHFEDWLRDGTEIGEGRWENVEELFNVTKKYSSRPWQESLENFLEEVALIAEVDELDGEKDSVTLMTLHSAKGLEFDTVFLVGLEEGLLPHSRSLFEPSQMAEEVRLAYVGLTRARINLFLTYAKRRQIFGNFNYNQPSRILRALPEDHIIHYGDEFEHRYANEMADDI